jgi:hypothetical protein
MDESPGERWWQRWIVIIGGPLVWGFGRQFGYLRVILVAVAAVAVAVVVVALTGLLVRLGRRMRRVVGVGQPIPPYFGISYVDQSANLCVCHTIPINLLVGAVQIARRRLKKGLDVRLGPRRPSATERKSP